MAIPLTQVRTSHALSIRANGQTVGLINSWAPSQSRTLTPVFEVAVDDSGNPIEYVPGNMSGLTINVNRFDAYAARLEEAFGTRDLVMLTRQSEPIDLYEIWTVPTRDPTAFDRGAANVLTSIGNAIGKSVDTSFINKERFVYSGCWFTSLGRTLSSDDNRIVNVNATLVYTKKIKVEGALGILL